MGGRMKKKAAKTIWHQHIGPSFRMICHLTPLQIVWKIQAKAKDIYYRSGLSSLLEEPAPTITNLQITPPILWPGSSRLGENIQHGTFTFMGKRIDMPEEINWYPPDACFFWISDLHSFGWLNHLREKDDKITARRFLNLWLNSCDSYHKTSWHPTPLSRRIIAWITHAQWLLSDADDTFKTHFLESLSHQIHHLQHNLAWDAGDHDIIHNLKALIYAGLCLPGLQSFYLDALDILSEQLDSQILPDGGHSARSPLFHLNVLRDILDIHALILKAGQTPPLQLDNVIDQMGLALSFYQYPRRTPWPL